MIGRGGRWIVRWCWRSRLGRRRRRRVGGRGGWWWWWLVVLFGGIDGGFLRCRHCFWGVLRGGRLIELRCCELMEQMRVPPKLRLVLIGTISSFSSVGGEFRGVGASNRHGCTYHQLPARFDEICHEFVTSQARATKGKRQERIERSIGRGSCRTTCNVSSSCLLPIVPACTGLHKFAYVYIMNRIKGNSNTSRF